LANAERLMLTCVQFTSRLTDSPAIIVDHESASIRKYVCQRLSSLIWWGVTENRCLGVVTSG
jgi:hypothetical protein